MSEIPNIIITDERKISETYSSCPSTVYQEVLNMFQSPAEMRDFWRTIRKRRKQAKETQKFFPTNPQIRSWIRTLEDDKPIRPPAEKCVSWLENRGVLRYSPDEKLRVLRSQNPLFPVINELAIFTLFTGGNHGYIPRVSCKSQEIAERLESYFERLLDIPFEVKIIDGSDVLLAEEHSKYIGRLLATLGVPSTSKRTSLKTLPTYWNDLGPDFRYKCAQQIYMANGRLLERYKHCSLRIHMPGVVDARDSEKLAEQLIGLFEESVGVPFEAYRDERGMAKSLEIYSKRTKDGLTMSKCEYYTKICNFLDSCIIHV